jgi:hypothetical protein
MPDFIFAYRSGKFKGGLYCKTWEFYIRILTFGATSSLTIAMEEKESSGSWILACP